MNSEARINELKQRLSEEMQLLRAVQDVGLACSVRASHFSTIISNGGGIGMDGYAFMAYNSAERDLFDVERLVEKEIKKMENELKKLEEEN